MPSAHDCPECQLAFAVTSPQARGYDNFYCNACLRRRLSGPSLHCTQCHFDVCGDCLPSGISLTPVAVTLIPAAGSVALSSTPVASQAPSAKVPCPKCRVPLAVASPQARRYTSYRCNVCQNTSSGLSLHCVQCKYDACGDCLPPGVRLAPVSSSNAIAGTPCPDCQDTLVVTSPQARGYDNFYCNACLRRRLSGPSLHCTQCHYDACGNCLPSGTNLDLTPASTPAAVSVAATASNAHTANSSTRPPSAEGLRTAVSNGGDASGAVAPISADGNKSAPSSCCVCLDACSVVAFVPCGHLCVCAQCADVCSNCPLCRVAVATRIRIYM